MNTDEQVLAVLEALPECMSWKQIFNCLKMREQVVAAMRHAMSYANKVKEVKKPAKLPAQCATCNTVVSFTDDDLLLGSKPHNHRLFVTGYIRGQKVKRILLDGGFAIIMPKFTVSDLGMMLISEPPSTKMRLTFCPRT